MCQGPLLGAEIYFLLKQETGEMPFLLCQDRFQSGKYVFH